MDQEKKVSAAKISKIVNAIIYYGTRNIGRIPAIEKFILSEIILAVAEYLTEGNHDCAHYGTEATWEVNVKREFPEIIKEKGDKVDPQLKNALLQLTDFKYKSTSRLSGTYDNCFYHLWEFPKIQADENSIYHFPKDFFLNVEENILPEMNPDILKDCKEIGEIMEDFIIKDIKRIEEIYKF